MPNRRQGSLRAILIHIVPIQQFGPHLICLRLESFIATIVCPMFVFAVRKYYINILTDCVCLICDELKISAYFVNNLIFFIFTKYTDVRIQFVGFLLRYKCKR